MLHLFATVLSLPVSIWRRTRLNVLRHGRDFPNSASSISTATLFSEYRQLSISVVSYSNTKTSSKFKPLSWMPLLQRLSLSHNNIADSSLSRKTFSCTPNLRVLDISFNKIRKCDSCIGALQCCSTLSELNLSGNPRKYNRHCSHRHCRLN